MPTLMSEETFSELARIHKCLREEGFGAATAGELAGVFVPWAGAELKQKGGIYYIGMATDRDTDGSTKQSFKTRLAITTDFCTKGRHFRASSPFWQFLDGLSWALFGAPFHETTNKWGWSNLLKIGWSSGNPHQWRAPVRPSLIDEQRVTCSKALSEEFTGLEDSWRPPRTAFSVRDERRVRLGS
jgi:hypothetical protein